jgi:hypothetical protein
LKKYLYNNNSYTIGLLTLSLGLFKISGYSFSIANILILHLFYIYVNKSNTKADIVYFGINIYLLVIAIFFIGNLDIIEFLKSYLLTTIMLFVFLSSLVKPIILKNFNLSRIISILSVALVFFEIIQICEYLILGSSNSWFLLDKFSISTATDVGRFQAVNFISFMRPISFYHEPSYLGIILLILLICANELKVKKIYLILIISGIILSFSTTALIFLILYTIFKNFNNFKNILIVISISTVLLFFFIDKETLDNIFRFNEILNSGTSGNERLIGPYDYLIDQFFHKKHYFGIPLGQSDLIFNNSFYLLFLYFGLFTPFLLLGFILFIFFRFKTNSIKYLIAFFSLLFLNGAIFTFESALILYCLNYAFNFSSNKFELTTILE